MVHRLRDNYINGKFKWMVSVGTKFKLYRVTSTNRYPLSMESMGPSQDVDIVETESYCFSSVTDRLLSLFLPLYLYLSPFIYRFEMKAGD